MCIAQPLRLDPADQPVAGAVRQPCHLGVQQRHLQLAPGVGRGSLHQCGQNGVSGKQPGHDVGDRDRDFHGPAFGLSLHAHDPAHALHQKVVSGPIGIGVVVGVAADRT